MRRVTTGPDVRTRRVVCGSVAVVASLWTLGMTSASAQQAPTMPSIQERFQASDRNRDGKLDREEFHRLIVEGFYFRDKDKKGYLTIEELREASPEAFKAANKKGDGRLTLDEYVNALFVDFDKADTNKDGMLTLEEIESYQRRSPR